MYYLLNIMIFTFDISYETITKAISRLRLTHLGVRGKKRLVVRLIELFQVVWSDIASKNSVSHYQIVRVERSAGATV